MLSHGNQAIKIPANRLSKNERDILKSQEVKMYAEMLHNCESKLEQLKQTKNIDNLEYNTLFNSQCRETEILFENSVRKHYRKKYFNEQKRELSFPTGEIYNPYNPYLQKYNHSYMRTYQEF